MAEYKTRPASRRDLLDFYGRLPERNSFSQVLERDGEVVGIAGYLVAGGVRFAFSETNDKIEEVPKTRIWKEAKKFMKLLPPCFCESKNSGEFLTRLGWEQVGEGNIYKWEP